jgi:hypothetical protein
MEARGCYQFGRQFGSSTSKLECWSNFSGVLISAYKGPHGLPRTGSEDSRSRRAFVGGDEGNKVALKVVDGQKVFALIRPHRINIINFLGCDGGINRKFALQEHSAFACANCKLGLRQKL